eukprot:GDKI01047048.1.p1 GENE.GDKI01047048.1~~GDKI01047048.1.p1  ORF type:complete len:161 (-),score=29.51 GDKI01047048.1:187-669(-)
MRITVLFALVSALCVSTSDAAVIRGRSASTLSSTTTPCVFDPDFYSNKYPDLQNAFHGDAGALLQHVKEYGLNEGRALCKNDDGTECVWNATAYANSYADLKNAFGYDADALKQHYITYGLTEGRTPCTPSKTIIVPRNLPGKIAFTMKRMAPANLPSAD